MPLDELRESLIAHGIRPLLPEALQAGTDWASEIQEQLKAADLVIGVLPRESESQWVLFELGQAWALGKRILLIAPPSVKAIPFALQRVQVLRIEPDNRQALDFALRQFLSAPTGSRKERTAETRAFQPRTLGPEADVLLARLANWESGGGHRALEAIAADAIRGSGADTVRLSSEPDRGADFAVWSDVLEPFVGNPLLVEIKSRIRDQASAETAFAQVSSYLTRSGARWALLLYGDGPERVDLQWQAIPPNVLVVSLHTLIEALRTRAFPELIRDLRNQRVHGVRP
jgi:hypothetical protein